jgi:hypothetical protein
VRLRGGVRAGVTGLKKAVYLCQARTMQIAKASGIGIDWERIFRCES